MIVRTTFTFLVFAVLLASSHGLYAQKKSSTKKALNQNTEKKETVLPVKVDSIVAREKISFKLNSKGDTINVVDGFRRKQGTWVESAGVSNIIQGENNYQIGQYLNDKKNGQWLSYSSNQLVAEENYKLGLRDGEMKLYEDGYLSVSGKYISVNKSKAYDTLELEDVDGRIITKVVPTDRGSYKTGDWYYYYPNTNKLMRKEFYVLDELEEVKEYQLYDSVQVQIINKKRLSAPKPTEWSRGGEKKEVVRYSDINPDGKGVKPNVRKQPAKK